MWSKNLFCLQPYESLGRYLSWHMHELTRYISLQESPLTFFLMKIKCVLCVSYFKMHFSSPCVVPKVPFLNCFGEAGLMMRSRACWGGSEGPSCNDGLFLPLLSSAGSGQPCRYCRGESSWASHAWRAPQADLPSFWRGPEPRTSHSDLL